MYLYFVYCKKFHFYNPQHSSQCNYKTSSMESKDLVESLYASLHCGLKNRKKVNENLRVIHVKKQILKKKIIFDSKFKEPKQRCNFYELPLHFSIFSSSSCWLIYHCLHSRKPWPLWEYVLYC